MWERGTHPVPRNHLLRVRLQQLRNYGGGGSVVAREVQGQLAATLQEASRDRVGRSAGCGDVGSGSVRAAGVCPGMQAT
jgi:hypothetical protein